MNRLTTLGAKHPLVSLSKNPYSQAVEFKLKYVGYSGIYALCTSASCTTYTDPSTGKQQLQCYCDVNNGKAVGINDGTVFTPYSSNNINYVYSLYSGVNSDLITKQTCNTGTWGDCLNKICTIDPNNSNKAYCKCMPVNSSPWVTFQNKNNTSPCSCDNLSGATNTAYTNIENFYKLYSFF